VISMAGGTEVEVELREWPMPVVKGRQRGTRWRFICMRCGASRDALHFVDGEWGCRGKNCLDPLGLGHACRHRQRYCPAIARRARLLRKLVRVRPGSLKAQAIREKIAQQEAAMLVHVQRVNHDLKKRRQRHARRIDSSQRSG